jgi:hypothetical protein
MENELSEKILCEDCILLPMCMIQVEFWETQDKNNNYLFIVPSKLLDKCSYLFLMHRHFTNIVKEFFWKKKGPSCLIKLSNSNPVAYLPDAYLKYPFNM